MKNVINQVKIAVVDDSDFFNNILTRQLTDYTKKLSMDNNLHYEIHSFVHADDFLRNLSANFDVIILDFFLGKGITAQHLMKNIFEQCHNSKVAIVSQTKNVHTSLVSLRKGAIAFIKKDREVLENVSFFVEDLANNKFLRTH
jgi:DNA-binding NtrC family response regulator